MRHHTLLVPGIVAALLAGCMSIRSSEPIGADAVARGIVVVRELPKALPSQTSRVPDSQYILVFAESAAVALLDLANPIPFVKEAVTATYNEHEARQYRERYASVDPYTIARDRLRGSPLVSGRADALHMMPLVYIVEGSDGRYRPTLVFRVEAGEWLGRYMAHLPTTYSAEDMKKSSPAMLQSLRGDLVAASDILRGLMERDARGELKGSGHKVSYGSYHLVGGNVGGLIPATIMTYSDAEIVEEDADHVILRSKGDLQAAGPQGALAFGVHYFRRDQLHTLKAAK